ncbi:potassium channel family protein [Aquipseudomonas guryensis]|jgi:K+ transporter|uniref:Two pore domain potassium channel family protein n=1 Tax=Aquipseudomonas guryensis TaxID=2759165 RepID=A0A7W4H3G5_9GAMM|nr:potassium channel family protein [Pseudomonas guryensis]MBB1519535.1 two pore domain potassium channel family protein [Pseudomonas guryensis]
MLMNLLLGIPMTVLCLVLQAVMVGLSLPLYMDYRQHQERHSRGTTILVLSLVMMLMLLGNLMQMGLWALLFVVLGEFDSFARALYFSGVTFATLGYGDVVLSPRWQLLSALEAANGILMFGVSTAVITTALGDVMKRYLQQLGR